MADQQSKDKSQIKLYNICFKSTYAQKALSGLSVQIAS